MLFPVSNHFLVLLDLVLMFLILFSAHASANLLSQWDESFRLPTGVIFYTAMQTSVN